MKCIYYLEWNYFKNKVWRKRGRARERAREHAAMSFFFL